MNATELRAALDRLHWSQAACARELEIPYRQVRYWAAGQPIPAAVEYALAWLIYSKELHT